ncbi:stromal interaction molecule 2-like [Antennarius striatus]|uniref:stromal interaction molecule 2-like n=1 Tax=Antennarius striatus TaxID=241820 RepID=UPI0035AE6859
MFLLSSLVLLVFKALFVVAGDLQGFTFPSEGGSFELTDPCMVVSPPCMSEADRYSLEALRSIHQMMDDDQDGGIEVEESVEFIIEDMKQQQTNKHSNLHREDQHITVEELWRGWKSSEVHNWTQDSVLRWLKEFVELPQYERNFKDFKVNGNTLPRIAANEPSFLSVHLRVQDQRDKQKLNIKALDVVLFGPPTRPPHNYMKDLLLIVSVVMGVGGCWFAQAQNKASKVHISKMMKDLESLQRAEQSLIDLQEQLERAQEEKRNVAEEKQNLEDKMRDEIMGAQEEANRLHELRQGAVSELSRLRYAEEELEQVLGALKQAEKDMYASWTVSGALQQWLQLTHEVEVQYYNVKKQSAVLQLACAKEEAERIKKKRSSVLGTLHVAHSSSLDQVDHKILEAKNALSEVTACLRERLHRWQQIERLCGFHIIRNLGLAKLTAQLYSDSVSLGLQRLPQPSCSCHSSVHGSLEDLLEESPVLPQMPVQPMTRSPRSKGSTVCRTRHPGIVTQPQVGMISPDPDLLIPIRATYTCFDEEEGRFLKTLKKQDSEEKFSDSEYKTSLPHSKRFPCSTADISSSKLCHDDAELLSDSSITKIMLKDTDSVVESPVRKSYVQELEASTDVSIRKTPKDKMFDCPLEPPSSNLSKEESIIDVTSRKSSKDKIEIPMNVSFRKGLPNELDSECPTWKVERDKTGDFMDSTPRNVFRERSDLPLDVRKILWNEMEKPTDVTTRKISADIMGVSIDSAIRKTVQDDADHPYDSVPKRISRDSMGVSLDTSSRKLPWNKGEGQYDFSMRALATDKMVGSTITPPRKISGDEPDHCSDNASVKIVSTEKSEALMDYSSPTDKYDFGLQSSTSRKILRDEPEMSSSFLKRRTPRIPRDDNDIDIPTGKISWTRADPPMEVHKQSLPKEESGPSDSSLFFSRSGQPDLTVTSQSPWKSSLDLSPFDPLSKLVYDGILEKPCKTMPTSLTGISASTPNLQQGSLLEEVEPPRVVLPSPASSCEGHKDKEKSKKSLKLKNLFKKKNESSPDKHQSGLQKL